MDGHREESWEINEIKGQRANLPPTPGEGFFPKNVSDGSSTILDQTLARSFFSLPEYLRRASVQIPN